MFKVNSRLVTTRLIRNWKQCSGMNLVKAIELRQQLNQYLGEIRRADGLHGLHSLTPKHLLLLPSVQRHSRSNMTLQPLKWGGGGRGWGGGGGRCRPFTLQVWLSTVEETCCLVTVINDFAYPLIIAHSGAERGPLIKMSWGTVGLFHLWQTPASLNNPRGRAEGISFKRNLTWAGHCQSTLTTTTFAWWST